MLQMIQEPQLYLSPEMIDWTLSLKRGENKYRINDMPVELTDAIKFAGAQKSAQLLTSIQMDDGDKVETGFNPFDDGAATDEEIEELTMSCYYYEGADVKKCEHCDYYTDQTVTTKDGHTFCSDCYEDLVHDATYN